MKKEETAFEDFYHEYYQISVRRPSVPLVSCEIRPVRTRHAARKVKRGATHFFSK